MAGEGCSAAVVMLLANDVTGMHSRHRPSDAVWMYTSV